MKKVKCVFLIGFILFLNLISLKNNDYGIKMVDSSNNTLSENNLSYNEESGIRLDSSSNNNISRNSVNYIGWMGIRLENSNNNTISLNSASYLLYFNSYFSFNK